MVEKFDKKKAEKQIKDIKNNKINPYNDAMKQSSKVDFMGKQVIAEKAGKGHKAALDLEKKAAEAGVTLDKAAMRRLDKIKDRYAQANQKSGFNKHQSDQEAHKDNVRKAEAFRSGAAAAAKKQRKEDYKGR